MLVAYYECDNLYDRQVNSWTVHEIVCSLISELDYHKKHDSPAG